VRRHGHGGGSGAAPGLRRRENDEAAQVEEDMDRIVERVQSVERFLIATRQQQGKILGMEGKCEPKSVHKVDQAVEDWITDRTEVMDGFTLFRNLQSSVLIPTGVSTVDSLLRGGLRECQITEIFGASPSGKTQLCHSIASSSACLGFEVKYITTNGTFSPERLITLSRHALKDLAHADMDASLAQLLTHVHVMHVHDTMSLVSTLQELEKECELATKQGRGVPKVVIVDSAAGLMSCDVGAAAHFGKFLINYLSSALVRGSTSALPEHPSIDTA